MNPVKAQPSEEAGPPGRIGEPAVAVGIFLLREGKVPQGAQGGR